MAPVQSLALLSQIPDGPLSFLRFSTWTGNQTNYENSNESVITDSRSATSCPVNYCHSNPMRHIYTLQKTQRNNEEWAGKENRLLMVSHGDGSTGLCLTTKAQRGGSLSQPSAPDRPQGLQTPQAERKSAGSDEHQQRPRSQHRDGTSRGLGRLPREAQQQLISQ